MEVFEPRLAASATSAEIIAEGLQSLNRRSHTVVSDSIQTPELS
jgi:hypothetical protein